MKKYVSLFLAMVLTLSLVACAKDEPGADTGEEASVPRKLRMQAPGTRQGRPGKRLLMMASGQRV